MKLLIRAAQNKWFQLLWTIFVFGIAVRAGASEQVVYIADAIAAKDGNYIKLHGGSAWTLSGRSIDSATYDIVIVFRSIKTQGGEAHTAPFVYIDDQEIPVQHLGGAFVTRTGYLTSVIESVDGGAFLKLEDQTLLSVSEYDRYDTSWWSPPYKALVTGDGKHLWNLTKNKRIWIKIVR